MQADDAATDYGNLGRQNAWYATEQNAAAAIGLLQRGSSRLNGEPSGHFRHRRQQRQAAAIIGDSLVGDCGHARAK
ncbi:hypothetical protein D3C87_1974850 [compost metagenome]